MVKSWVDSEYHVQKITKTFSKRFKSKLIRISKKKKIKDGIYLEEKENMLVIVNNLNKNKIYLEKKRLKFTTGSNNYQNLLASYESNYL